MDDRVKGAVISAIASSSPHLIKAGMNMLKSSPKEEQYKILSEKMDDIKGNMDNRRERQPSGGNMSNVENRTANTPAERVLKHIDMYKDADNHDASHLRDSIDILKANPDAMECDACIEQLEAAKDLAEKGRHDDAIMALMGIGKYLAKKETA